MWAQTAGPTVTLSDAAVLSLTLTAPNGLMADATLEFMVTVTDSGGFPHEDTVAVAVLAGGSWHQQTRQIQASGICCHPMASDPAVGYGDEVAYSPIPRRNHPRSRALQSNPRILSLVIALSIG